MGIFGPNPFEAEIEKATDVSKVGEDWTFILDVCDKVNSQPGSSKDCLRAIMRRMGQSDPHIVIKAITLLDSCVNNCGKAFQLEIASREFENEFRKILTKNQEKGVSQKLRQVLKQWAESDFKDDPQLNLIPSLYMKLREEGVDFSNLTDKPAKSAAAVKAAADALKDPNVVSSQQEQDDIAKAIELSLKEVKNSPKHSGTGSSSGAAASYPSLYPSFSSGNNATATQSQSAPQAEPRQVQASYDFEAVEDNELTFYTGEIIHVLDDSDPNWWRGYNKRGEGLFPSNFVTADLSSVPDHLDKASEEAAAAKQQQEQQQKTEAATAAMANQRIEIDEMKIERLLHLLHEANPEDPSQDTEEMLNLEQEVHQMGPLIDAELERVDQKHAQLTQLSSDLVDAMNLYHSLMRDDMDMNGYLMGVNMPLGMGPRNMMGYGGSMPRGGYPIICSTLPPVVTHSRDAIAAMSYGGTGVPMSHIPMPRQPPGGPMPFIYQNGNIKPVPPHGLVDPLLNGISPDEQLKRLRQQFESSSTPNTQQQQQQMPSTGLHVMSPQHQALPYGQPQTQQQPHTNHHSPHVNVPPQTQPHPQQPPLQTQGPPLQQQQQQQQLQQGHMQPPFTSLPNGGHPNQMPPYHMQPTAQQHPQMPPNQTHLANQPPPSHHQISQIVPPNEVLAHLQTQMAGMSMGGTQGIHPMPMPIGGAIGVHAGGMMGGQYNHGEFAEQKTDIPIYQQQR